MKTRKKIDPVSEAIAVFSAELAELRGRVAALSTDHNGGKPEIYLAAEDGVIIRYHHHDEEDHHAVA